MFIFYFILPISCMLVIFILPGIYFHFISYLFPLLLLIYRIFHSLVFNFILIFYLYFHFIFILYLSFILSILSSVLSCRMYFIHYYSVSDFHILSLILYPIFHFIMIVFIFDVSFFILFLFSSHC